MVAIILLFILLSSEICVATEVRVALGELQNSLTMLQAEIRKEPEIFTILRSIRTLGDLQKLRGKIPGGLTSRSGVLTVAEERETDFQTKKRIAQEYVEAFLRAMRSYYAKYAVKPRTLMSADNKWDQEALEKNKKAIADDIDKANMGRTIAERVGTLIPRLAAYFNFLNKPFDDKDNLKLDQDDFKYFFDRVLIAEKSYGLNVRQVMNGYEDCCYIGVDRLQYAFSRITDFTPTLYAHIREHVADAVFPFTKCPPADQVLYTIFSRVNVAPFKNEAGGLDLFESEALAFVAIDLLEILTYKYGSAAKKLGIVIPPVPPVEKWREEAKKGKNVADDIGKALLRVVNVAEYQKNEGAYSNLKDFLSRVENFGTILRLDLANLNVVIYALEGYVRLIQKKEVEEKDKQEKEREAGERGTWEQQQAEKERLERQHSRLKSASQRESERQGAIRRGAQWPDTYFGKIEDEIDALEVFQRIKNEAIQHDNIKVEAQGIDIPTIEDITDNALRDGNLAKWIYRQLALLWHTDKWVNRSELEKKKAEENFKVLKEADEAMEKYVADLRQYEKARFPKVDVQKAPVKKLLVQKSSEMTEID